tara:strand:+ start:1627 stop:2052 length:426 start_codon:yes stop_codon:yes gene_type:complete
MRIIKIVFISGFLFVSELVLSQTGLSDLCVEKGKASYYGNQFHGRRTANGEVFDQMAFTAAHRTLPFGTLVKVTNLVNYESVLVRINDRGPFNKHRIIDLSKGAAESIGLIDSGVGEVLMECIFEPVPAVEKSKSEIDTLQ